MKDRLRELACGIGLTLALALPGSAVAASINVTTTLDEFNLNSSACSLREAIWAANNDGIAMAPGCTPGSGPDVVNVSAGTHGLVRGPAGDESGLNGDLDVTGMLTIRRAGAGAATIDARGLDRVLNVQNGADLTVDGVTIRGGVTQATAGGGIFNQGATAELTIRNSTIMGNTAIDANGGGIFSNGASLTIENTTISGNRTSLFGGGIDAAGAEASLRNVTITGNTADYDAGPDGNGGGVIRANGTLTLANTIVAGNADASAGAEAPDCSGGNGTISSEGNNLIGDLTGCSLMAQGSDITGKDARLGALADNGGPTLTHSLLAGSPAIGKASAAAPALDQRGLPRVKAPDLGSYERTLCRGILVNRIGTAGKNKLLGTSSADGILGLGGNDVLRGLAGGDGLCGGKGRDRLIGGKGKDRLAGQAGRDRCIGGKGRDRASGCEVRRRIP